MVHLASHAAHPYEVGETRSHPCSCLSVISHSLFSFKYDLASTHIASRRRPERRATPEETVFELASRNDEDAADGSSQLNPVQESGVKQKPTQG